MSAKRERTPKAFKIVAGGKRASRHPRIEAPKNSFRAEGAKQLSHSATSHISSHAPANCYSNSRSSEFYSSSSRRVEMFIEHKFKKIALAPEERNIAHLGYSSPANIALLWSASR